MVINSPLKKNPETN